MNRRSFLRSLGLGAAALTLDPERLLWVPGVKRIFIPPPTGWGTVGKITEVHFSRVGLAWRLAFKGVLRTQDLILHLKSGESVDFDPISAQPYLTSTCS